MMVDFEQETEKIESWEREQGWETKDPFTHLTDPELFVGFDDILKKFYRFAALGKNYAVLYGQYGYGKTSIIKKLSHEYRKKYNVVFFEDAPEREYIAEKIKELCSGKLVRALTLKKLDDYDYTSFNKLVHKRTILIFDEAHSMDEKTFSYLRSLSESGTKFTLIFAGKPELVTGKKALPQYLSDRLELSEALRPLTEKESVELIKKRVELLGKSSNYLFSEEAMKKIAKESRYIPRETLEHCSRMVEYAIQNNTHDIDVKDVAKYLTLTEDAAILVYAPEESKPRKMIEIDEEPEEKINTYERIVEGSMPKHNPRNSYNIERESFLRELSPLQKRIILYLFDNEPKSARELSIGIDDTYDTIRHMLKRLQGKYGEAETKKNIKDLFPLIEERENPNGRGYAYSLSAQTRKVLSTD